MWFDSALGVSTAGGTRPLAAVLARRCVREQLQARHRTRRPCPGRTQEYQCPPSPRRPPLDSTPVFHNRRAVHPLILTVPTPIPLTRSLVCAAPAPPGPGNPHRSHWSAEPARTTSTTRRSPHRM